MLNKPGAANMTTYRKSFMLHRGPISIDFGFKRPDYYDHVKFDRTTRLKYSNFAIVTLTSLVKVPTIPVSSPLKKRRIGFLPPLAQETIE